MPAPSIVTVLDPAVNVPEFDQLPPSSQFDVPALHSTSVPIVMLPEISTVVPFAKVDVFAPAVCSRLVAVIAWKLDVSASVTVTAPPFVIAPEEQAMLPVVWTYLPKAIQGGGDFLCVTETVTPRALDVIPGIVSAEDRGCMLCVYNDTVEEIPLEGGEILAEGRTIPPHAEFHRRASVSTGPGMDSSGSKDSI